MADLKDILNDGNQEIDSQKLMEYLNGQLSNAAQHDLEAQMGDDADMLSDAMEGLQMVENKRNLDLTVFDLNKKLKQQLQLKEKKKRKGRIQNFQLTIIAIVVILLLCVLAFVIIKMRNTP